jgi:hypothetical protein
LFLRNGLWLELSGQQKRNEKNYFEIRAMSSQAFFP